MHYVIMHIDVPKAKSYHCFLFLCIYSSNLSEPPSANDSGVGEDDEDSVQNHENEKEKEKKDDVTEDENQKPKKKA